jgi:hypothetical protein
MARTRENSFINLMNHIQVLVILQHHKSKLIIVNPTDITAGEHSITKLNKIYDEFFK